MTRKSSTFLLGLLLCAAANAATISTTMTVRGSGALTGTTFTGTADLTGIGTGLAITNGNFSTGATGFVATFVINVSAADRINVTLNIPASIISGSATATGTITGGTGTYAGATGTFASMPGTGTLSGTTLTLSFSGPGTIETGGTGGGGATGPAITEVLDAGSYTRNIAQGSIFVVKGTGLSAAGFTQLSFPLPTTRDGVKITFTPAAGGAGIDAYLVYLYNQSGVNQLAAVLPSTVAPGNYNVTVTNGTASAPVAVQVVQRKLGLITADSSGSGLAVIQNYVSASQLDIDRFTTFSSGGFTFSPSKPGQVLIAWATGMGPVTGGDNIASPGFDFNASGVTVRVIVGGVSITPLYAGRAPGLAGADQINFQLPANVPTGCTVSFQVSVNGVLSNPSFIAIAPDAGATACVTPGYTTDQLRNFDNGGSFTVGGLSITQYQLSIPGVGSGKSNFIGGSFTKFTGFQLAAASQGNVSVIQQGSCQVVTVTSTGTDTSTGSGNVTYLDAGNISITGPAGSSLSNTAVTKTVTAASRPLGPVISYGLSNFEGFPLPGQTNFALPAGTYTVNGAGGTDVGNFNASITIGTPLTLSPALPASVNRSQPLTLNWTGGNASDLVQIVGSSSTTSGTGANAVTTSTSFICLTTAGQRTFTVPSSVLSQLPATSQGGSLIVASGLTSTFTAPLRPSGAIDAGFFSSFVGIGASPTYQ